MSKTLYIGSDATKNLVGDNTKARVRVGADGRTQIRFTNRTSLVNMPDDEKVVDLAVKGGGRRISLAGDLAGTLQAGDKIALTYVKYGWYTVGTPADGQEILGSVSK
jgi:hypothetical protein